MTGVGGPGGVGPKGPGNGVGGIDGVDDGLDVDGLDETGAAGPTTGATAAQRTDAASAAARADGSSATGELGSVDALAREIAAGRLSVREAIDQLTAAAGAGLPADEQVELREMLGEMFATDPHLQRLIAQAGGK